MAARDGFIRAERRIDEQEQKKNMPEQLALFTYEIFPVESVDK